MKNQLGVPIVFTREKDIRHADAGWRRDMSKVGGSTGGSGLFPAHFEALSSLF